jgi:hypothetical protein
MTWPAVTGARGPSRTLAESDSGGRPSARASARAGAGRGPLRSARSSTARGAARGGRGSAVRGSPDRGSPEPGFARPGLSRPRLARPGFARPGFGPGRSGFGGARLGGARGWAAAWDGPRRWRRHQGRFRPWDLVTQARQQVAPGRRVGAGAQRQALFARVESSQVGGAQLGAAGRLGQARWRGDRRRGQARRGIDLGEQRHRGALVGGERQLPAAHPSDGGAGGAGLGPGRRRLIGHPHRAAVEELILVGGVVELPGLSEGQRRHGAGGVIGDQRAHAHAASRLLVAGRRQRQADSGPRAARWRRRVSHDGLRGGEAPRGQRRGGQRRGGRWLPRVIGWRSAFDSTPAARVVGILG